MEILISLIQFIALIVGITATASIYVKTQFKNDVNGGLMFLFGFSWAVFICLVYLM